MRKANNIFPKLNLEPIQHPELQPGEVLLTNIRNGKNLTGEAAELKTTRWGTVAYGAGGQVVPHCVPVFVQRGELEAAGYDADDPFGYRGSRVRHEAAIARMRRGVD